MENGNDDDDPHASLPFDFLVFLNSRNMIRRVWSLLLKAFCILAEIDFPNVRIFSNWVWM